MGKLAYVRDIFSNPNYDGAKLNEGLNQYGLELVDAIFNEAKRRSIPQNGRHFGRIADGVMTYLSFIENSIHKF